MCSETKNYEGAKKEDGPMTLKCIDKESRIIWSISHHESKKNVEQSLATKFINSVPVIQFHCKKSTLRNIKSRNLKHKLYQM